MAAPSQSIVFDVQDCKVYPLTSDLTAGSPVYGAGVDVFGIAQIAFDPNLVTAELKGDARVIAKRGRVDRFNFSATYGKLDLAVLEVLLNPTITSAGAGDAETTQAVFAGGTQLPYFKIAAQLTDVDTGLGGITLVLYKAQITGGTLVGTQSDQFGQPTFDAEGISIDGTADGVLGAMAKILFEETATAL